MGRRGEAIQILGAEINRPNPALMAALSRAEAGGAIDVLDFYRQSNWRERKAQERKAVGLGAGIV